MSKRSVVSALRLRQHLQRGLDDDAERAERAGDDARDVVAGDVLDHLAAEVHQLAAAREQGHAEQVIAQGAGAHPGRPRQAGGDHAADGRAGAEVRRLEGEALAMLGELGLERGDAHAGGRGDDQLGRLVLARAVEAAQVELVAVRRLAVEVLAAAAAQAERADRKRWRRAGARPARTGRPATRSKPRQVGKRDQAALDVHLPVLGAAHQRRDDLARIEQAGRIEGPLDGAHPLALGRRELHAHRRQLLDADAVLAGDGAAHGDAEVEDLGAEGLGAMQLVAVVGIEQDQRMQVAVAGMEDVGAAQAVRASPCRRSRSACRPGACAGWSSPCTCSRG